MLKIIIPANSIDVAADLSPICGDKMFDSLIYGGKYNQVRLMAVKCCTNLSYRDNISRAVRVIHTGSVRIIVKKIHRLI